MTTISQLPKMTKTFEKLKLILDIEKHANPNTIMGKAILSSLAKKNTSHDEILTFIRDQAEDSPKVMSNVIGNDLTERILNYKP